MTLAYYFDAFAEKDFRVYHIHEGEQRGVPHKWTVRLRGPMGADQWAVGYGATLEQACAGAHAQMTSVETDIFA